MATALKSTPGTGGNVEPKASKPYQGVNITRLPTEVEEERHDTTSTSTFHVYSKGEAHQSISPTIDSTKERRSGPTTAQQKAEKEERKRLRTDSYAKDTDENGFFLHRPYVAFHDPPRVLYAGNTKYAKPVVLIHTGGFWRYYKLQIGPSLGLPGVLDPRGVVSWKHNGGDKKALEADDRKLKGYKVRNWRLWGEHGKEYVQTVNKNRKNKEGADPDVFEKDDSDTSWPQRADEVLYLRWTSPLSRRTRQYHFHYGGVEFCWKGTGTVKESRRCGKMLRFNHLKLVAKLAVDPKQAEEGEQREVCLGKYTSSVAALKYGKIEFFDATILRLVEDHLPWVQAQQSAAVQGTENREVAQEEEDDLDKISKLKKSTLYQIFIATAMCMVMGEKEKRQTLFAVLESAGEGGG